MRPVLRLGTAGAGIDVDDGGGIVVLAAEHLRNFHRPHFRTQLGQNRTGLGPILIARIFGEHFTNDTDVVVEPLGLRHTLDDRNQGGFLFGNATSFLGVAPKTLLGLQGPNLF